MTDNQTTLLSPSHPYSISNRKYEPTTKDEEYYKSILTNKTHPISKTHEHPHQPQQHSPTNPNIKQLILIKNIKHRRISAIIGCVLIHLALGSIYTFGNMLPYIASYMSSNINQYTYYSDMCTYIYSFAVCAHGIFTPVGGKLEQLIGPQITIFIGGLIFSTAVAVSFFTCTNIYLLYLTYGFLFGTGIGIAYPCCLVCAMKWYPNKKGYINGIVLAGFGCSALIFDRIQTSFINPTNISINVLTGFIDDEILLERIPYCFLLLGGIFLVMIIIGTLLINNPPSDYISMENYLENNNDQNGGAFDFFDESKLDFNDTGSNDNIYDDTLPLLPPLNANPNPNQIGIISNETLVAFDVQQVLKSMTFWHLYLCFFIDGLVIVFIATQWKEYSNSYLYITNDSMLSMIGAIAALFNGFGRIFWGFILDKTQSIRVTLGIINVLLVVLLFVWPSLKSLSGAEFYLEFLDLVFVGLLFGLLCGNFVVFPTAITWIFGVKNNGINLGLLFTSQILCSFAGVYALDLFLGYVGWRYVTWFMGSIQAVGFVVAVTIPK